MLRSAIALLLLVLATTPAHAASWEAAVEALQNGEFKKAAGLMKRLAPQGDQRAQFVMGVLYLQGRGVDRDPAHAARWLLRSARNGYVPSQALLGRMYLLGDGVEANPVEALKWYRSAADYGDSNAQGSLGVLYEHGVAGLSADARLAARWFAIAAKNGNERAAKHFERVSAKLNAEEKSAVERNAEMWKPKLAPRTSGISADDAARRLGDELGIDSADIAGALR